MMKDDLFNKTVSLISKVYELEVALDSPENYIDVTDLQLNLLKVLYFSCSKNVSSLSQCLNINLPNCSREVKKLTVKGFIEKKTSQSDKRQTELALTKLGNSKVEYFLSNMKKNFFSRDKVWTDEKLKLCLDSIDTLMEELL